ncbi:MAG: enoyl-CoA hydratase [Tateyamaria sp.]|uniref:enoyl-CoA hydratase n=1 Tax=Tateyamaria sp. TaxID=1929288 RepID=UPI0032DD3353
MVLGFAAKTRESKMAILEREVTGAVMHLRMNAPERLNALSDEMIAALHSALDEVADDRSVRAVVLSGAGKAFCAGHDLKQMTAGRQNADGGAAYFKDLFDRCADMMARIQSLPQPVIAQVHGIATAAGCQLVATCDLAVAAHGTRFGVNGVNIGLFCSTPMVALSRNIPRKQAFEMLTTGEFVEAERAQTLGLINRAVAPEDLESEAAALAEQLASKLGSAVRIGKEAFYAQIQMPVADAYAYTGQVMVDNMVHPDTKEGIDAFINKRPPEWSQ